MQLIGVDGAYSWIVAGSSFFLCMMMYGTYRLSGILFVASMPRYGVSRQAASFPYTFAGFTKNVSGPLVGILLHKFSIRTLILSGCALAAIGIGGCFFAENIFVVTVLWGVVFGFGFSLACSLVPVLINQYFFRQRATALGFAFSGMCIGSLFLPPLVELCIEYYGISGTFLILSGLVLNCFPFAIFLRARIPHSKDETGAQKRIPEQKKTSTNPNFKFVKSESQSILQEKIIFCSSEKTPLLASNGQLQPNGFLYSSISERKPISSNEKVENNSNETYQTYISGITKDGPLKSKNNESHSNVPSSFDHQLSSKIDRKPLASSKKDAVGEINDTLKSNESNGKNNDIVTDSEHNESFNVLTTSLVSNKSTSCDPKENIENNVPSLSIIHVSGTNQCKDLNSFLNDLSSQKRESVHDKLAISSPAVGPLSDTTADGLCQNREKMNRQDTTIAIVSDNSDNHFAPNDMPVNSTKSSKSTCSGNCSLLLNFTYLAILFTKTLSNSIQICVTTVIFDYARDIGISNLDGQYILMFSSMGDLLGMLSSGLVANNNCMSNSMLMVICFVGQGFSALAISWSTGFYFLGAGLFVYSFIYSVVQIMMNLIIAEDIEEDKQAFAITSSSFLAGPASLLISPLIGYLRDEIGTYTYLFYGIGVLCFLTAIIWLIQYFLIKRKPMHAKIK